MNKDKEERRERLKLRSRRSSRQSAYAESLPEMRWQNFCEASAIQFVMNGKSKSPISEEDARIIIANFRNVSVNDVSMCDPCVDYLKGKTMAAIEDMFGNDDTYQELVKMMKKLRFELEDKLLMIEEEATPCPPSDINDELEIDVWTEYSLELDPFHDALDGYQCDDETDIYVSDTELPPKTLPTSSSLQPPRTAPPHKVLSLQCSYSLPVMDAKSQMVKDLFQSEKERKHSIDIGSPSCSSFHSDVVFPLPVLTSVPSVPMTYHDELDLDDRDELDDIRGIVDIDEIASIASMGNTLPPLDENSITHLCTYLNTPNFSQDNIF